MILRRGARISLRYTGPLRTLQPGVDAFAVAAQRLKFSSEAEGADSSRKGWVPSWLRDRLPGAITGEPKEAEELTLDKFASTLKQARRLGSVSKYVPGAPKISDPALNSNFQLYEAIVGAMTREEKADLSRFSPAGRQRVAQEAGCSVAQVDDCIAKYQWMRVMLTKVAEAKAQGKPMPSSVEDLETAVKGSWQDFKAAQPSGGAGDAEAVQSGPPHRVAPAGQLMVPQNAMRAPGKPCPLAGQPVGRNTRCPAGRKAYKACCGRRYV